MSTRKFFMTAWPRRGAYFTCETCGCEFYLSPSYIKKAQQKGAVIRYCSMKCYDKTGEKNPFWGKSHRKDSIQKMSANPNRPKFRPAEENPNYSRYKEENGFVGTSKDWWLRKFLMSPSASCEICGFSDKRALSLHHINRNRKENTRGNLRLLCWNCHVIEHYKDRSGIYKELIYDRFDREKKNVEV